MYSSIFDCMSFFPTMHLHSVIFVTVWSRLARFQAAAYEDKARRLEIDLETSQKENQVISEQVNLTPWRWDYHHETQEQFFFS